MTASMPDRCGGNEAHDAVKPVAHRAQLHEACANKQLSEPVRDLLQVVIWSKFLSMLDLAIRVGYIRVFVLPPPQAPLAPA